jgi:hypothetical protein
MQGLVDRRGHTELGAAAHHEAVEVVDLGRPAARHVLRGGRALARHRPAMAAIAASEASRSIVLPGGLRHGHHLAHHGVLQLDDRRQRGHAAVRLLGQARDRVVGAVDHQLAPQLAHHVGRDAHRHLGGGEQRHHRLQPRASAASAAAAASIGPITRSPRPWCCTSPGPGIAVATYTATGTTRWPDRWRASVGVVHAVLQAQHQRVGLEQRRDLRATASVSVDFTQNSTRSASRTASSSVLAASGTAWVWPFMCRRRPPVMACTCGARPISVTTWPARASIAP